MSASRSGAAGAWWGRPLWGGANWRRGGALPGGAGGERPPRVPRRAGGALAEVVGDEPTPEFAAMVAEECRLRLDSLRDETFRRVALAKMEGYTNQEIAARLGLSLRSVERKLEAIRKRWRPEDAT